MKWEKSINSNCNILSNQQELREKFAKKQLLLDAVRMDQIHTDQIMTCIQLYFQKQGKQKRK